MSLLLGSFISSLVSEQYPSGNLITAESPTSAIVSGPDILRVDYLKYCLAKKIRKNRCFYITINHRRYNEILKDPVIKKHVVEFKQRSKKENTH